MISRLGAVVSSFELNGECPSGVSWKRSPVISLTYKLYPHQSILVCFRKGFEADLHL